MTKALHTAVKSFWTGQHTAGHKGLVLTDTLIRHAAETGDWTPLARFVSRAGSDRSKIGLIIRAAFGDQMVYKKDPKHECGGKFIKNWKGEQFNLEGSNTYGVVTEAIANKKSFRSEDFQKDLRALFGKAEAPKPDEAKIIAGLIKYLGTKAELMGKKPDYLLVAAQAELKKQAAADKAAA